VTKILNPDEDPGLFNLRIDRIDIVTNVGDGGTTRPVTLDAGLHRVSETAGRDTRLDDYIVVIGGDCAPDGTVTLVRGDVKACTITNTRK
jgi:hypothetical protein